LHLKMWQTEMMSDSIDDALDDDEAEEETEELTNQVLFCKASREVLEIVTRLLMKRCHVPTLHLSRDFVSHPWCSCFYTCKFEKDWWDPHFYGLCRIQILDEIGVDVTAQV
jgi:hypothetical protein